MSEAVKRVMAALATPIQKRERLSKRWKGLVAANFVKELEKATLVAVDEENAEGVNKSDVLEDALVIRASTLSATVKAKFKEEFNADIVQFVLGPNGGSADIKRDQSGNLLAVEMQEDGLNTVFSADQLHAAFTVEEKEKKEKKVKVEKIDTGKGGKAFFSVGL